MNKTIIFPLLILVLASCGHPENYTHKIDDQTGLEKLTITYIPTNGEDIVNDGRLVVIRTDTAEFQPHHFQDSVMLVLAHKGGLYKAPVSASKYFNLNGTITITQNVYHEYFPAEWSSLRQSNNHLTYRFVHDEAHFYFLVFNTINGEMIASYYEYE